MATASLSLLLSLALGTSAVALRDEPAPRETAVAAAGVHDQGGARHPERLQAFPVPSMLAGDDVGGRGSARDAATPNVAPPDEATVAPSAPTSPAPATASPTDGQAPAGVQTPAPAAAPASAAPDCAVQACVALTFDDGPGPDTARLLDELSARAVHATFFVVGREIASFPGVVGREAAEGHVVGNHTWDHAALPGLTEPAVGAELDSTDQAIVAAGAPAPVLGRPPYGSTSPLVAQAYGARGLVGVLWDVDTEDWKNRDAAVTTQRALDTVHPGAIILMHDIRPSTVDAVPGLVDALRARGFTLVTVPQLLAAPVPGTFYRQR